jgi:hypothetical protein
MTSRLYFVLHPQPEIGKLDTSLRYTDILFGFVIKELFVRLQNWAEIGAAIRWQLSVATVLVLCSWIGFRRSLNRTGYEVKFFNLPLMKFVADQLMLILYFRIAVLTGTDGTTTFDANGLSQHTIWLLVGVFGLYAVWDAFGIWMCLSRRRAGAEKVPRYPAIESDAATSKPTMTAKPQRADWWGFGITIAGGFTLYIVAALSCALMWQVQMMAALLALLVYRFSKEIRTSWRSL